jgi:cellulose synthase/poly-beta-1,6-N-acetylglucosamine synthase-like glycosyltransferase
MTVSTIILYCILFASLYFQIFLLLTFLDRKKKPAENNTLNNASLPAVTIAVPCFNEEATLTSTVLSLLALNYPKDKLTVMVVDDGSADGTFAVATALSKKYPQVEVYRQENGGKYTVLNFALSKCTTPFFGCLDADSFVHPEALLRIMQCFTEDMSAITPAIVVHEPKNILQKIQKMEYNLGVFVRHTFSLLNALQVTPGPFSIFRKKVFETIGGYKHAHNTEDMEIALRMQAHKLKIGNCPNAYVYTVTPPTLRKLYRQRVRWVTGFLKNALDYKFLFFKKEYGNLGVLTLPFAVFSIITALYFTVLAVIELVKYVSEKYLEISIIGLQFNPSFDWFFLNTEMVALLTLVALAGSVAVLLIGKRMAEGNIRLSADFFYFIFLYGFIPPFWLTKSLYNVLLSKRTTWR